jgi:polyisoprenoid-binding protein YceI
LPENINGEPGSTPEAAQVAAPIGDRYVINPIISRFTVKVTATGMLSAFGHSPTIQILDLKGEIVFGPRALEHSALQLVVRADSLTVAGNISDKDRREIEHQMREQVLETSKYPDIIYDSQSVSVKSSVDGNSDVVLLGQLTLHGATRPQKIQARITVTGDLLRAFGEFSLRQSDYNIKPVSAVGGGLKVKDEVIFSFDIAARKQS